MSDPDPLETIGRISREIASLQVRIRNHVYRSAWDADTLQSLRGEIDARKAELQRLQERLRDTAPRGSGAVGRKNTQTAVEETETMSITDARRIANALFTQRPLDPGSAAWASYTMICASLVRLLDNELVSDPDFSPVEFLRHCGLGAEQADTMARRPGDFIRRSEDALGPQNQ